MAILQPHDGSLDRRRQPIRLTMRPPRAIGEGLHAGVFVAVEDLVAVTIEKSIRRRTLAAVIGSLVIASPYSRTTSGRSIEHSGSRYTVRDTIWANPHVTIAVDVESNGSIEHWRVGGSSPQFMSKCGWTKKTLTPGDVITVIGYRFKDGTTAALMRTIVLASGQEMYYRGATAFEGAVRTSGPVIRRLKSFAPVSDRLGGVVACANRPRNPFEQRRVWRDTCLLALGTVVLTTLPRHIAEFLQVSLRQRRRHRQCVVHGGRGLGMSLGPGQHFAMRAQRRRESRQDGV